MEKLTIILKNRLKESRDKTEREEVKVKETFSIKDVLFIMLKNQKELAKKQLKLVKSRRYLTKLLYYSLEVMRRALNFTTTNRKEESSEINHSTEINSKIIEYLKSRVN